MLSANYGPAFFGTKRRPGLGGGGGGVLGESNSYHETSTKFKMDTNCEPRSESPRKRARHGKSVCYQMDFFASEDAKQGFLGRIDNAKSHLAPKGAAPLDSRELLSSLLDRLEATPRDPGTTLWCAIRFKKIFL